MTSNFLMGNSISKVLWILKLTLLDLEHYLTINKCGLLYSLLDILLT